MGIAAWNPTQQVRALVLIAEAQAALVGHSRVCLGSQQIETQLEAAGRRALPTILHEMTEWSALRLAGAREAVRSAILQYQGSSAWAERVTSDAAQRLRQAWRFADAGRHLDDLARSVAASDEPQVIRWFGYHVNACLRHRADHVVECAEAGQLWDFAIERLRQANNVLGLPGVQVAADGNRSGPPPSSGRSAESGSTPYQPTTHAESDSDSASDAGAGSRALRRRPPQI